MIRLLITLAFVGLSLSASRADEGSRPNVLMISIDDLNDWIGCLDGHPQTLTPNIDRLAARGLLFTNAHCASPACNPSRATIFSGKMPWKTGVWSNTSDHFFKQHPNAGQPDGRVLPMSFRDSGYATFGTGKLMHGGNRDNEKMFQHHFGVEQRWSPLTKADVQYTDDELPSKGTDNPRHLVKLNDGRELILPLNRMASDRNPNKPDGESMDWGSMDVPDSAMGDTQITDWVIKQLAEMGGQPFFMGVGFYRPHIPLWAPAKYFERFDGQPIELPPCLENDLDDLSPTGRRWAIEAVTAGLHSSVVQNGQWEEAVKSYLACTTYVDGQVGRLLDALDASPHAGNTIIVLWSDHGWHLGEKQHWGKWTAWQRSTRVPLMISVPSSKHAGVECDQPVSLIDLYPTLLDLCQIENPGELDGHSLVPLIEQPDTETARTIVTSIDRGNVTLLDDQHRYIRYADGSEELYDVTRDPNEWNNLIHHEDEQAVTTAFRSKIPEAAK